MNGNHVMAAGLPDAVHASQQGFRALLDAMARPGQIRKIGAALPDVPLGGAMARLLLSLTDDETPVWWQSVANCPSDWLRFHTGAPLTTDPTTAGFAVLLDSNTSPDLDSFSIGSAVSPEFSTTLLIELPSLTEGPGMEWHGPGIQVPLAVHLAGLPDRFWPLWQANHGALPCGVDLIFTCGAYAMGLPRTTRIRQLKGV